MTIKFTVEVTEEDVTEEPDSSWYYEHRISNDVGGSIVGSIVGGGSIVGIVGVAGIGVGSAGVGSAGVAGVGVGVGSYN